ncbi:MAG: hypothetical protein IKK21_12615 [Clostridia bacterium]|nr:hypothetical protein [Clostridia bacterium]
MRVTEQQVAQALRPWLGRALTEETSLCAGAAQIINAYAPYRDTLEDLAARLEKYLFDELYTLLGPAMTLRLDDGRALRIRMRELPELADEIMGAMFEGMQVYSVTYDNLKDYAMRAGSLSAMRVLYQKYGEFQSPDETALLMRIIRERCPAWRYAQWLPAEEQA